MTPPLPLPEVSVDATTKAFPAVARRVPLTEVAEQGWTLFDLIPPVLVLRESALRHNLELMAGFCREHSVSIAPHGKTSMSPQLWRRQLDAGAWGITAATVVQARVMRAAGVPRILIANEVVDAGSAEWLCEQLSDPAVALICYVDSPRGVAILEHHARRAPSERPIDVLVELGHEDGRTGCRGVGDAIELAERVRSSALLRLAGVAGYEGTICRERTKGCLGAVRGYLDDLRTLASTLLERGAFESADEIVVTAGGSAFFDLVVERLAGDWPAGSPVRIVLRSGCYLTHDSGMYERLSPFGGRAGAHFRPAMEVWGAVLSRPEPDLALVGLGKRDVPFDEGLPAPHTLRRADGERIGATGRITMMSLNDQHAFCRVEAGFRVEVGDVVGSGISHPCTAFDKWRVIPVVDDEDSVVDALATFF